MSKVAAKVPDIELYFPGGKKKIHKEGDKYRAPAVSYRGFWVSTERFYILSKVATKVPDIELYFPGGKKKNP